MPWSAEKEARMKALEAELGGKQEAPAGWTSGKEARLAALEKETAGPSTYSPSQVLERGAKGFLNAVPMAQSLYDLSKGENPYKATPEGMGRLAGDIGGTAGAIAFGGVPAIAKFAGVSGALEAAGAGKAVAAADRFVDKILPDAQTRSVTGNMLLNAPKAAIQTGIEFLPSLLAGKVSTMKSKAHAADVEAPPSTRNTALAQAAQERGVPVTQGAIEGGKAAIREKQFAMNPNTSQLAEEFYKRQNEAQKGSLASEGSERFGDPYLSQELGSGQFDKARLLGDVKGKLKDVRREAGKEVGAAKQGAYEKLPIIAGLGKTFGDALADLGQKYNIPEDVAAMPEINRNGVNRKAASIFKNVMDEASQVKTLKQAQGILDTLDESISGAFKSGEIANKNTPLFTEMRQRVNSIMGKALEGVSPSAAASLEAAKSKFAKIAEPTKQLYKDLERADPQEAFGKLINSQGKVGKVDAIKLVFEEKDPAFIKQFQARALQELALRSMTGETLSPAKFAKEWGPTGIFKDGLKEAIFTPDQIKAVDEHLAIQKLNMGPREVMGTQAAGGSQTQARQGITKALGGALQHVPGIGAVAKLGAAVKGPYDRYAANKYFGAAERPPVVTEAPAPRPFANRQARSPFLAAILTANQARQKSAEAR